LSEINAKNTPYLALRLKPHAAWLTDYRGIRRKLQRGRT
jgi:hypothetical protein